MRSDKLETFKRNMASKPKQELAEYPSELKKLKTFLTEDVWQLFEEAGVIIAGGAITSIFTNSDVNDIDVYFRSEKQLVNTVASIYGDDILSDNLFDIAEGYSMIYNGYSQRTLMFKNMDTDQEVQFMTFKYFKDADEIFDTFDYTCCMGAYDFKAGGFVLHKDFLKHNAQKYLKFHPGTAYPIMSLMRVDKYRQKGYDISKSELLRVCATCMSLKIDSWEDLKEHVGGMYGYDLNDVFDEDREFSLEEFVSQMDTIDERDIRKYQMYGGGSDLMDILQVFVDKREFNLPDPKFDDKKYLYKCVTEDWQSPIWSRSKLTYNVGDVLQEDGGIFFHASSDKPYHTSKYWVEAELIEGEVEEFAIQKVVTKGKVKIVRCFEYEPVANKLRNLLEDKYGFVEKRKPKKQDGQNSIAIGLNTIAYSR